MLVRPDAISAILIACQPKNAAGSAEGYGDVEQVRPSRPRKVAHVVKSCHVIDTRPPRTTEIYSASSKVIVAARRLQIGRHFRLPRKLT
jgi:hypothetical protein